MKSRQVISVSEALQEKFMRPLGLSAYAVAKQTRVPVSRIQDLLHGRRQVTVDTSIRLGRCFDVPEDYFLNLQNTWDLQRAVEENGEEYRGIERIKSKIN